MGRRKLKLGIRLDRRREKEGRRDRRKEWVFESSEEARGHCNHTSSVSFQVRTNFCFGESRNRDRTSRGAGAAHDRLILPRLELETRTGTDSTGSLVDRQLKN